MHVLAIANHKGGVGKSTVTVNLAAALAERGRRVLVIDTDAQGTATAWLRHAPAPGLYQTFAEGAPLEPVETGIANVWLVPAAAEMREDALRVGMFAALRRAVRRLDAWSHVLIDCPPRYGLVSLAALVASSEVLVPTEASVMTLAGLASVVQAIDEAASAVDGQSPRLVGVLVNRADLRQVNARQAVAVVREHYGPLAFATVIRDTVRLRDAGALAMSILELDPNGPGATDFRALAAELEERLARGH